MAVIAEVVGYLSTLTMIKADILDSLWFSEQVFSQAGKIITHWEAVFCPKLLKLFSI